MPRAWIISRPIVGRIAVRFPCEVRNLLHGPDVRRRIAMAVETKRHVQRLHLFHFHHLVDAAMATDTTHADGDVRLMVEEHVIGNPMHAHPLDSACRCCSYRELFPVAGSAASPAYGSSCRLRSAELPRARTY